MDNSVLILTLVGANNIGAYLQAFSMQETLRENGYDTAFGVLPAVSSGNAKKCGKLGKIKKYLFSRNIKKLLFKGKDAKKYAKARERLSFCKFDAENEYERVVVGSDEVWNLRSRSFYHHPQYFGNGIKVKHLVSYAPSVGNMSVDDAQKRGLSFDKFTAISVRDENGYNIVKAIDGREPVKVLDPTFLVSSFDKYITEQSCKKDFIMVYSYGISEDCVKKVKAFAKKAGLPLYSVGTYNKWCDKNINVDPFEFLWYLKKAKYVVTSTFHGTALSINFNKQFVAFTESSAKLLGVLESFGLSERNAYNKDDVSALFEHEIDYQKINEIIKTEREESLKFLLDGLAE